MNLPTRLLALWDHLGLGASHVATQMPADSPVFASAYPGRISGEVFCTPTRHDPAGRPNQPDHIPDLPVVGASVIRLVRALLLDRNDKWATSRRYMTLEIIDPLSDDRSVALPPMTA